LRETQYYPADDLKLENKKAKSRYVWKGYVSDKEDPSYPWTNLVGTEIVSLDSNAVLDCPSIPRYERFASIPRTELSEEQSLGILKFATEELSKQWKERKDQLEKEVAAALIREKNSGRKEEAQKECSDDSRG
jgi:hypothetical protein